MNALAIRWDGYEFAEQADRQFHRLLLAVAVPFVLLAILSLVFRLEQAPRVGGVYTAPATIELLAAETAPLAEKIEQPAAAKEDTKELPQVAAPKTLEKPVITPKPVVVPDPVISAREVAKRSGVMAFADQLADLRNQGDAVNQEQPLLASKGAASTASGGAAAAGNAERALAAAASGSSGIGAAGDAGVTRSQSGAGLGKRRTTTMQSPLGFGRDAAKAGEGGSTRGGGRGLNDIQLVFDRASGAFNVMYVRALRDNAALGGKVVLSLTIEPSGRVSDCRIVSSQLGDPELERKIVQRVLLLNFGPKDVATFTYPNFPVVFAPP